MGFNVEKRRRCSIQYGIALFHARSHFCAARWANFRPPVGKCMVGLKARCVGGLEERGGYNLGLLVGIPETLCDRQSYLRLSLRGLIEAIGEADD